MIAPLLVKLHQALELRLEVIHRFPGALLGSRIKFKVGGRFRWVSRLFRLRFLPIVFRLRVRFRGRRLLQHRVLLQFLFNEGLQLQRGGLQEGERLLQLRCQHHRLRHALRQM